jgi:hypothetical protein
LISVRLVERFLKNGVSDMNAIPKNSKVRSVNVRGARFAKIGLAAGLVTMWSLSACAPSKQFFTEAKGGAGVLADESLDLGAENGSVDSSNGSAGNSGSGNGNPGGGGISDPGQGVDPTDAQKCFKYVRAEEQQHPYGNDIVPSQPQTPMELSPELAVDPRLVADARAPSLASNVLVQPSRIGRAPGERVSLRPVPIAESPIDPIPEVPIIVGIEKLQVCIRTLQPIKVGDVDVEVIVPYSDDATKLNNGQVEKIYCKPEPVPCATEVPGLDEASPAPTPKHFGPALQAAQ